MSLVFNLWPPKLSEFSVDLGLVLKTISGKLINAVAKRNKSLAVNLLGTQFKYMELKVVPTDPRLVQH